LSSFAHETGTLASDGSKFDSSRDRDQPFKFTLGTDSVIKGWDLGVATMKKGEKSLFTIRADYGYGASGSGDSIPGGATLKFEVELLRFGETEVSGTNGEVVVRMKHKGEGWRSPEKGDQVLIKYTMTSEGKEIFSLNEFTPYLVSSHSIIRRIV
jgi:FK506-binding protein 4/5